MACERKRMKSTVVAETGRRTSIILVFLAMTVAIAGILVVTQKPARAHDHRLPKTVLMKGGQELQTGRKVWEYSWTSPSGGGTCVTEQAILTFGFPGDVTSVAADSVLRVRIHKSQKPQHFYLSKVDENGTTIRQLRVRLDPVVRRGRTEAWDAIFRVSRPDSDYYLTTEGHWPDREGCNGDQYAFWSFHVKTRAA